MRVSGLNMTMRERIQLGNHVTTKQEIIINAILAIFQLTLNSLKNRNSLVFQRASKFF